MIEQAEFTKQCPFHELRCGERFLCEWCKGYGFIKDVCQAKVLENVKWFDRAVARISGSGNPYIYTADVRMFWNNERKEWLVYCRSSEVGWFENIGEIKRKLLL